MRVVPIMLIALFFTVLASSCHAEYQGDEFARQDRGPQYVSSELIVKFKPGAIKKTEEGKVEGATEEAKALLGRFSIQSITPVFHTAKPETDLGRTYKITFAKSINLTEAMNAFKSHPAVEYAEPNRIMHTMSQQVDSF